MQCEDSKAVKRVGNEKLFTYHELAQFVPLWAKGVERLCCQPSFIGSPQAVFPCDQAISSEELEDLVQRAEQPGEQQEKKKPKTRHVVCNIGGSYQLSAFKLLQTRHDSMVPRV